MRLHNCRNPRFFLGNDLQMVEFLALGPFGSGGFQSPGPVQLTPGPSRNIVGLMQWISR